MAPKRKFKAGGNNQVATIVTNGGEPVNAEKVEKDLQYLRETTASVEAAHVVSVPAPFSDKYFPIDLGTSKSEIPVFYIAGDLYTQMLPFTPHSVERTVSGTDAA